MNNKALIKWGWLRAVVGLVIFYPVIDNSIYVLRLMAQIFDASFNRLCVVANTLVLTLLVVYLVRKFIDRKSFTSLGFSIKGFSRDILYGFIGSFAIMGATLLTLKLLGNIQSTSFNPDFSFLIYWAGVFLFAAALEEITFRGYMLSNLMDSMNRFVALGIVSILFGLGHAAGQNASIISLLNCVLLGILVGLYYIHRQNLWMPITFHMGWNFFQGTIFGFNVSGKSFDYSLMGIKVSGNELITGGKAGLEGSLILTVLTILAIFIYLVINRRQQGKNK